VQTDKIVATISRFLFLLFPISCAMSMVGIATHFLGIFSVCKFVIVI